MRNPRHVAGTAILFVCLPLVGACNDIPSSSDVRWHLEREIPGASFERESHLRLGRFSMAFAKRIALWAMDDDEETRDIVAKIRSVDIATYRVVSMPTEIDPKTIQKLDRKLAENGWLPLVREREDGSQTWIMTRHDNDGGIRGLLIVELDSWELAIVGVAGKLDEILTQAIADDPAGFSGMFGP